MSGDTPTCIDVINAPKLVNETGEKTSTTEHPLCRELPRLKWAEREDVVFVSYSIKKGVHKTSINEYTAHFKNTKTLICEGIYFNLREEIVPSLTNITLKEEEITLELNKVVPKYWKKLLDEEHMKKYKNIVSVDWDLYDECDEDFKEVSFEGCEDYGEGSNDLFDENSEDEIDNKIQVKEENENEQEQIKEPKQGQGQGQEKNEDDKEKEAPKGEFEQSLDTKDTKDAEIKPAELEKMEKVEIIES